MKSVILGINKNHNSVEYKNKIVNSVLGNSRDIDTLQSTIEEIIPFLTDGDRTLRTNSMYLLSILDGDIDIASVKLRILDIAITKINDNATLDSAIKIIDQNINNIQCDKLTQIFDALIVVDLRSNLISHRLAAYNLLSKLICTDSVKINANEETISSFRRFCGYEQDPRCLTIIFDIFPTFSKKVLPFIDEDLRAKLFDTISVFYPITQRPELAKQLCESLTKLSEFSNDIAALAASKLSTAMSDTRSPIYATLGCLLIHEADDKFVADVVVSFAKSLREYYANGATDTTGSVVDSAVTSIVHYIDINKQSHQNLIQTAMSNWIPEIINSTDISTIRAFSIVAWSLDTVLHFSEIALLPLSATLSDAIKNSNQEKVHSIMASIAEYLRYQSRSEEVEKRFLPFFESAVSVLRNKFNQNIYTAALVVVREILEHSFVPLYDDAVVSIRSHLNLIQSSQCLIALSEQPDYAKSLTENLVQPCIEALKNNCDTDFATLSDIVNLITKLAVTQFYATQFLPILATTNRFRVLLKCILPQECIEDETAIAILQEIAPNYFDSHDDIILAVGLRSSNSTLTAAISKFPSLAHLLIFVAPDECIPTDANLRHPIAAFAFGAKRTDYPSGFIPPAASLAFRNEIRDDFCKEDIARLLEYENLLDGACGPVFAKFDVIAERFLYDADYKAALWALWAGALDDHREYLVKLCLLCPPECFIGALPRLLPMLPSFLIVDAKGGLDLVLFALLAVDGRLVDALESQIPELVQILLGILEQGDARERLDACRVLRAAAARASGCADLRPIVTRRLMRALDDGKREVRQEAVQARLAWLKV